MFLLGEPGSGKTMLASRMHTILPDLDDDTALVATSLHSLAGTLRDGEALVRRPPILTPHHSATMAALVGGGHARITPGAASLAHGGVLFLDEAAQFQPSVLDALREPLENGEVHIHRAGLHARLPARFQLLLAANPCPCGGGRQGRSCTCSAQARMRYLARLSGPLLDRIDITVRVDTPTRADLARGPSPSSARLRERVAEAKAEGTTILIVLHELGKLGPLLDRELHISAGHVSYDGPPHIEDDHEQHHVGGDHCQPTIDPGAAPTDHGLVSGI